MVEVDHNVVDQETIDTCEAHEAHEAYETHETHELHGSHDIDNVTENSKLPLPEETQTEQKQEQQHEEGAVVGGGEKKWPGWPGESVFRMLVPAPKVGSIIGRKGEYIKKLVEETRARIKILDGPPGTAERAVLCSKFKATTQSSIESQT